MSYIYDLYKPIQKNELKDVAAIELNDKIKPLTNIKIADIPKFFTDLKDIAYQNYSIIERVMINEKRTIYFTSGLHDIRILNEYKKKKNKRADSNSGIGSTFLVIDFDIGNFHREKIIPFSREEYLRIIKQNLLKHVFAAFTPLPPHYVVYSGGGIHLVYLIDELFRGNNEFFKKIRTFFSILSAQPIEIKGEGGKTIFQRYKKGLYFKISTEKGDLYFGLDSATIDVFYRILKPPFVLNWDYQFNEEGKWIRGIYTEILFKNGNLKRYSLEEISSKLHELLKNFEEVVEYNESFIEASDFLHSKQIVAFLEKEFKDERAIEGFDKEQLISELFEFLENEGWYVAGKRQNLVLALSGILAKLRFSEREVKEIIKAIAERFNDEETYMRIKAVEYTFKRYREGAQIAGISLLWEKQFVMSWNRKEDEKLDKLLKIIEKHTTKNKELDKKIKINKSLSEDEFILRAEALYQVVPYFYDDMTENFYIYDLNEKIYKQISETSLITYFLSYLDEGLRKKITSPTQRNRLLNGMRTVGEMNKPIKPKETWIKFKNKIVDIETGEEFEPSPEYFFVNNIPHNLGDSEETPIIDSLLESWVGPENKQLLYEILAYSILPDYPIHKFFILFGSGRNGKSSFIKLLTNFVGEENTVSTDLALLSNSQNRFESARLYHKLVAFCNETDYEILKKTGLIKSLTGNDKIRGEYKFKKQFSFRNYAKIIIATNVIPLSSDSSDAFYSRAIIVDFPNTFKKAKDIIKSIPEEEYENLGRKSIRILRELLERGEFTNEGSIEEKREKYEMRANPIKLFINEKCETDINGYIPSSEFIYEFNKWIQSANIKIYKKSWNWRKEIKPILESMGLETGVQRKVNGVNLRCIVGLRWKQEGSKGSKSSTFSNSHIYSSTLNNKSATSATIDDTTQKKLNVEYIDVPSSAFEKKEEKLDKEENKNKHIEEINVSDLIKEESQNHSIISNVSQNTRLEEKEVKT